MAKQNQGIIELDSEDVKRKYMNFKKFDVVDDYSDHQYSNSISSRWQQPSKNWAKKIQEEWRILERNLPDMIFVRVYEGRMDLLRAVIIGAEGTPYHDGLFFFDVCFPKNYPKDPPLVHYHSGGLRINPNLYNDGKVCLSLLNTWLGAKEERWRPEVSTMLQILVSIQGMILNAKPYFNEPGFEFLRGSSFGNQFALQYNQRTLVYSVKTMVYTINKPPKHFEDLVRGHFRNRARGILTSCKSYYTTGSADKCGIVVVRKSGYSRSSTKQIKGYMKTLVGAFKQVAGADDDLEDFVVEAENLKLQLQKKKKNINYKNLIQKILSCFGI